MPNHTSQKRITCMVGTRPEVLKMAPVVAAMRAIGLSVQVVNSGQQSSLTGQALCNVGLEADATLELTRKDSSLNALTSELMTAIAAHLKEHPCAILMVHGDGLSHGVGHPLPMAFRTHAKGKKPTDTGTSQRGNSRDRQHLYRRIAKHRRSLGTRNPASLATHSGTFSKIWKAQPSCHAASPGKLGPAP